MNYQTLINTSIKRLRQDNALTQEAFAEKIGISLQGLSNIERNRYQPTAQTIDKICKVFKISPLELLAISNDDTEDIIKNIAILLSQLPKSKLKKILNIVELIIKL